MPTKMRLSGKTVLITGAAGGIGAASVAALHARGANTVLTDLDQDAVDKVAARLGDTRVLPLAVDVTDTDGLRDIVEQAVARFGSLDVVVANAGIAADPPATIATIDPAMFEKVVEIDLLGVWRTVYAALPHIIAARGHVLVTASVYAYFNGTVNAPYAMAKAGVEQFGRALRTELAIHGATAGVLYPGWVRTPIARAAFGDNDLITAMREQLYPKFLASAIEPEVVAGRMVTGIENRSARIMVPRRWQPISALRGIVNPLIDRSLERNTRLKAMLGQLETRARARAAISDGDPIGG
ncbi:MULTISPECIES: short-chain dehydrogenase/reductase [unclassified Rhodococcus (in: high G+C Gram-positive bacteria)]|uniref:short-chain dehydrogenase/reductase n=1 Tax=unclassified Rhodococcus (in: high G+C Gram-positive bacteria) TaxID=192944 RepID=UPI0020789D64|nr:MULTISPECIES: short-chain dehydrogenase/reductase [unclassified Rhodococcus (in: high G+C Gram-positive bacteria)]